MREGTTETETERERPRQRESDGGRDREEATEIEGTAIFDLYGASPILWIVSNRFQVNKPISQGFRVFMATYFGNDVIW